MSTRCSGQKRRSPAENRVDVSAADSAAWRAAAIVRTALKNGAATDTVVVGCGVPRRALAGGASFHGGGGWDDRSHGSAHRARERRRPLRVDEQCGPRSLRGVNSRLARRRPARRRGVRDHSAARFGRGDATLDLLGGRRGLPQAAARGVVGVVDLFMRLDGRDDWQRRVDAGFDALRVLGIRRLPAAYLDRAICKGLKSGMRSGDHLAGTVSVGPLKVITDGSLNTRTAYCCDPYPEQVREPLRSVERAAV